MKATVERLRLGIALGVVMIAGAVRAAPAVNLICDGNGVRDTMGSRRHNQVDESRFPIASYTIRLDFDRGTVTVDTPFGVWPYVEYGRVDAPITHLEAAELKFDWLLPEERRNVYPAEIDAQVDGFIDRISAYGCAVLYLEGLSSQG
jgi:hypothetical protein